MKDKNTNNICGNVFHGSANIIISNDHNIEKNKDGKTANYMPEPIWRSPITMSILSWLSFFISLIGIFQLYKIFEPVINLMTNKSIKANPINNMYSYILVVIILVLILIFSLRRITKKETRHPLFFNYAISGFGRKLTIEKIHIEKCPICGGKMKYFNKPIEWRDVLSSDGKIKRKITKRVPALQCKRNPEHWYKVDLAEDKLE